MTIKAQLSSAQASSSTTNAGLASFDSSEFSVDSNGYVSLSGNIPLTFDTDNGSASPSAGVITFNAVSQAGSSVTFSGSASTVSLNTTDSNDNTIIGLNAGNTSITGTNNTALGYKAGTALTSASNNVLIGYEAGTALTSNSSNVAIGYLSLGSSQTGGQNVAVGQQSLYGYTGLGACTAVGYGALFSLSTGVGDAFGWSSLINTTGASNAAFGWASGTLITTGTQNCAFGNSALKGGTLITGSNNVAMGYSSLANVSGAISNNTCIGSSSGFNYQSTESNNIILGYNIEGTRGESNVIRIGNSSNTSCYITGIEGVTVSNPQTVYVNTSTGQLGSGPSGSLSNYTAVNHAASPYTVLSTDVYLGVTSSAGVVTIELPNAPSIGTLYTIKDTAGSAVSENITVTTVGGSVTIDGSTSYVLKTNYQAISVIFNGTSYEVF